MGILAAVVAPCPVVVAPGPAAVDAPVPAEALCTDEAGVAGLAATAAVVGLALGTAVVFVLVAVVAAAVPVLVGALAFTELAGGVLFIMLVYNLLA
jgi:hypothetical protein